jgi:hypothetical protein
MIDPAGTLAGSRQATALPTHGPAYSWLTEQVSYLPVRGAQSAPRLLEVMHRNGLPFAR